MSKECHYIFCDNPTNEPNKHCGGCQEALTPELEITSRSEIGRRMAELEEGCISVVVGGDMNKDDPFPAKSERFTDEEIEAHTLYYASKDWGNDPDIVKVVRQLQTDLQEKEQTIRNFSNTLRISMETTAKLQSDLASVKAECLPYLKAQQQVLWNDPSPMLDDLFAKIEVLIKKLQAGS